MPNFAFLALEHSIKKKHKDIIKNLYRGVLDVSLALLIEISNHLLGFSHSVLFAGDRNLLIFFDR